MVANIEKILNSFYYLCKIEYKQVILEQLLFRECKFLDVAFCRMK